MAHNGLQYIDVAIILIIIRHGLETRPLNIQVILFYGWLIPPWNEIYKINPNDTAIASPVWNV